MAGVSLMPLNASFGSATMQVLKNNKGTIGLGAGFAVLADSEMRNDFANGDYLSGTTRLTNDVVTTVVAQKVTGSIKEKIFGKKAVESATNLVSNKTSSNTIMNTVKGTGKKVISGAADLGKKALSGATKHGKNLLPKVSSKTASSVLKSVGPKVLTKGGYVGLAVGGVLIATGVIIGLTSGKSEAKPINKSDTDKKASELAKKKIFDDANIDKQPTVAEPEYENKASIIDGNDGTFGEVKTDAKGNLDYENSVKYELNAGLNINEIDSEKYEVKYLSAENITEDDLKGNDTKANNLKAALIAEAVGELGGKSSVSVEEFKKLGFTNPESYDFTGENGEPDGIITAAEYAAANLYIDANDTADGKIDGKYTNIGVAKLGSMLQKNSADENRQIFKQYYDKFGLGQAEAYINKQEAEKAKIDTPVKSEQSVPSGIWEEGNSASQGSKSIQLERGKTLGDLVLANKKELSEKYGITQLWGKDGLVNLIAQKNGFDGFQDEKLKKLDVGYEFQI